MNRSGDRNAHVIDVVDNSRKPEEERSGKDKVFDLFIKKSENFSKTVKKRISKRFREEDCFVIVYHGSGGERRPESFDFDKARESNDFGRAMYFGLTVKMARDWASLRKNGVVNWYLFKAADSYRDESIQVKILNDPLEWINTILSIHDRRYSVKADIIIGDTMDARTGTVIEKYRRLADSMGIMMSEFDDSTKLRMVSELNPEHFGQQIAFRNQQSLKHVEFMGSIGVDEMDDSWMTDPSEVAVRVADLLMEQDGLTQNEALVSFMKSDTFRRLMKDGDLTELPPGRLLEMYRGEA